jgi:hypothetical protein
MRTDINICKKIWSVSLALLTNEFYYGFEKIQDTNPLENNYSGTELSDCLLRSPNKILLIILVIKMW